MKILKTYTIDADKMKIKVDIVAGQDFTMLYKVSIPSVSEATKALLDSVKEELLKETRIGTEEIFDPNKISELKKSFEEKAKEIIEKKIPLTNEKSKDMLIGQLLHEMLGLGNIEILLNDGDLEEIVINTSREPIWVYHKQFGWLKTNIIPESENQIHNYASIIARRVGRQITTLSPLLDAHATLFPISTKGNSISIRKFARKPWTITDFIENKTLNSEVAAFLWLCIQYELNMIIAGGTSSGKTALLNCLMPFIQPNHRIISIEDTRELQLPDFLHWVPLTTREPNPEGKGEVTMLDLMINSLRFFIGCL